MTPGKPSAGLLEAAIAYAAAGLQAFPLYGIRNARCACGKLACSSAGKHPNNRMTTDGLYDATTDADMIRCWWEGCPDSNIGVRTGKESGVIVIDIDGPEGETALAKAVGTLPPTWHSTTGKGHHYWFRHPGFTVGNRARLLPAVDVRGDGGYVAAPPSRHIKGTTYKWVVPPTEPLAELPEAFLMLLNKPATGRPSARNAQIPQGQRNDTLYRRARSMKCAAGFGIAAIEAALVADNETQCAPPLDEQEVRGIARRARTQPDRADFQTIEVLETDFFPLMSFDFIIKQELPPVNWLVQSLFALQDRVLWYGEFGSFKSWLLLDLALHISAGKPWLGHFHIPAPRSVLYVDEEMNQSMLQRRVRQLAAGAGLTSSTLPFASLSRWGLRMDASGPNRLLNEIHCRGFDPDVIIVETFRRVLVGSENDAQDVAEFWRMVEPLQRGGKTLIVSHHMKKPSNIGHQVRYQASGSTDILGGAESGYAITRDTKRKNEIKIESVKLRAAGEPPPFKVEFSADEEAAALRYIGSGDTERTEAESQALSALMTIAQFLEEGGNVSVRAAQIKAHCITAGYSERTIERALTMGLEDHVLQRPKQGWYQLVR